MIQLADFSVKWDGTVTLSAILPTLGFLLSGWLGWRAWKKETHERDEKKQVENEAKIKSEAERTAEIKGMVVAIHDQGGSIDRHSEVIASLAADMKSIVERLSEMLGVKESVIRLEERTKALESDSNLSKKSRSTGNSAGAT